MNVLITRRIVRMICLILGGVLFLNASGCRPYRDTTPQELAKVEVKNYQGKDLSSVNDFRENSIKGPQYINKQTYRFKITGIVKRPQNLSIDQVLKDKKRYKKMVKLDCVEGWSVNILWEGILVRDLIASSFPRAAVKTVIFHAKDGYSTSFPVDYFMKNDIIMAYKMNGVEIPPERGFPFMLVAEDKWGYKWCKWITGIELSADPNYRGYWESRGYSNSGDRDKSYFAK